MTNRRHAHHSQEARGRLASYAIEARTACGLSQEEMASPDHGGPSTTTCHYIESGDWGDRHDFTRKTKWQYEHAVGWAPGSIDTILGSPDGKPRLLVAGRIGDQLIQRRVSLGMQHRDAWCADRRLDPGLVHDAEQGLLYKFTEWQVAHLEKGYGLIRGTIRMNLTGQATELAAIPGGEGGGRQPCSLPSSPVMRRRLRSSFSGRWKLMNGKATGTSRTGRVKLNRRTGTPC